MQWFAFLERQFFSEYSFLNNENCHEKNFLFCKIALKDYFAKTTMTALIWKNWGFLILFYHFRTGNDNVMYEKKCSVLMGYGSCSTF